MIKFNFYKLFLHLAVRGSLKKMKDENYLKLIYKAIMGKKLNLDNPKTFNEKLNWLKLYDRNPIYTKMVDKYEAKKYAANVIGEKYIIPTLGIYDGFDDIDFNKLPNQFVMKCTHDSGGLIICKDKSRLDIKISKKKINKFLKRKYFYLWREWPYKNVKPRIIIEDFMIDNKTNELRDYKFFCFNGKVKFFKIDFNRDTNHQANYYDRDGNLEHFGEFTFYPAAGFGEFIPNEWDRKLGDMLELPKEKITDEK